MRNILLLAAIGLSVPGAAAAAPQAPGTPAAQGMAMPATGCTAPGVLPRALAGWNRRRPAAAATATAGLRSARIAIGRGVDLALRPTSGIAYPLTPAHPGGDGSDGGLAGFTVAVAGTYRVAIGSGAWIDIVRDGHAVDSIAHGHGPDCTGVHKMVDFPLVPGAYVLQVAGNDTATLPLLVTRLR